MEEVATKRSHPKKETSLYLDDRKVLSQYPIVCKPRQPVESSFNGQYISLVNFDLVLIVCRAGGKCKFMQIRRQILCRRYLERGSERGLLQRVGGQYHFTVVLLQSDGFAVLWSRGYYGI